MSSNSHYIGILHFSWGRRAGKLIVDTSTIVKFVLYTCENISNVFLFVMGIMAVWIVYAYKLQKHLVYLPPTYDQVAPFKCEYCPSLNPNIYRNGLLWCTWSQLQASNWSFWSITVWIWRWSKHFLLIGRGREWVWIEVEIPHSIQALNWTFSLPTPPLMDPRRPSHNQRDEKNRLWLYGKCLYGQLSNPHSLAVGKLSIRTQSLQSRMLKEPNIKNTCFSPMKGLPWTGLD